MSDTQVLLGKIAAVRERLEKVQIQRPGGDSKNNGPPLLAALVASLPAIEEPDRVQVLQESVHRGARHGELLDGALKELADAAGMKAELHRLPRQLTPRAHRLLEIGRKLLTRLRTIDAQLGSNDILDDEDPLTAWHRETVAMVDVALHIVQAFPDSPSDQLRLCEGLEVILRAVGERVAILVQALEKRRHDISRLDTLADLLICLESGRLIELKPFAEIAEAILVEARQAGPLRFHYPFDIQTPRPNSEDGKLSLGHESADAHWVARFVACHSLIVAQVMARVMQPAAEWRGRLTESIVAALIHDVGMLRVPAEILVQKDPLTVEQR